MEWKTVWTHEIVKDNYVTKSPLEKNHILASKIVAAKFK